MSNQCESHTAKQIGEASGILSCRYLQGSRSFPESLSVEILRNGQVLLCRINANLFLCGMDSFCDAEGIQVVLTVQERLELLKRIQIERKQITGKYPMKTLAAWKESGLGSFEDFCFPGDEVDEELVNDFVNCIPPVMFRSFCTQSGEPYSHEPDGTGRFCPTYITFHKINEDRWQFDGYCFLGENQNQVDRPSHLQQAVGRLLKDMDRKDETYA